MMEPNVSADGGALRRMSESAAFHILATVPLRTGKELCDRRRVGAAAPRDFSSRTGYVTQMPNFVGGNSAQAPPQTTKPGGTQSKYGARPTGEQVVGRSVEISGGCRKVGDRPLP